MSKVTSKLQVTIPKILALRYGIAPGQEIDWRASGDAIEVRLRRDADQTSADFRLRLFDQATERQIARQRLRPVGPAPADRGWTREELYDRGR